MRDSRLVHEGTELQGETDIHADLTFTLVVHPSCQYDKSLGEAFSEAWLSR